MAQEGGEVSQVPDPDLFKDLGVVAGLLVTVVVGGIAALTYFLRRLVAAVDRMAAAQEATPVIIARMETLIVERFVRIEGKLDEAVSLGQEHVRIARMWERTEAPGRSIKEGL